MSEPKNVDKICPLLGSHQIKAAATTLKLPQRTIFGQGYDLISCQKHRCELWDINRAACSLAWPHHSFQEAANALYELGSAVRDIVELMKIIGGPTHGNG